MTNELVQKAKECKSAEELLDLANENGIEMTAEEAKERFAALNNEGELSDDELDAASGGACHTKVDGKKYTVVSSGLKCFTGGWECVYAWETYGTPTHTTVFLRKDHKSLREPWSACSSEGKCGTCLHLEFKNGLGYCGLSGK